MDDNWFKLPLDKKVGHNMELIKGICREHTRPALTANRMFLKQASSEDLTRHMLAAALECGELQLNLESTFQVVIDTAVSVCNVPVVSLALLFGARPKDVIGMASGKCIPNMADRYRFLFILQTSLLELIQSPEAATAPG